MHSKVADGIANSVDPDQTAPFGAVWSGSALFAQIYLSENLGSLLDTAVGLKDAEGMSYSVDSDRAEIQLSKNLFLL